MCDEKNQSADIKGPYNYKIIIIIVKTVLLYQTIPMILAVYSINVKLPQFSYERHFGSFF